MRLARRTRALTLVAALALCGNIALLVMPARSDGAEVHARLWSMDVNFVDFPGAVRGPQPYLDQHGAWRTPAGQPARLGDTTNRAGPDNVDGPRYLVTASLGRDGSYGNFLRTLDAMVKDHACIVAIADSEAVPPGQRLRTSPVLEIASGSASCPA